MGGDLVGYVWGKTNERVEIPIVNEREHQTYFGALDIVEGKVVLQAQEKGNIECMINYLKYLMEYFKGHRLLLIWDGASYHCSKEIKKFLTKVNEGYPKEQWRIHCVCLAPNRPKQNPIEDVWLQGKNWLRRHANWKPSFSHIKQFFELFFSLDIFNLPKMHMYGKFSKIK